MNKARRIGIKASNSISVRDGVVGEEVFVLSGGKWELVVNNSVLNGVTRRVFCVKPSRGKTDVAGGLCFTSMESLEEAIDDLISLFPEIRDALDRD